MEHPKQGDLPGVHYVQLVDNRFYEPYESDKMTI